MDNHIFLLQYAHMFEILHCCVAGTIVWTCLNFCKAVRQAAAQRGGACEKLRKAAAAQSGPERWRSWKNGGQATSAQGGNRIERVRIDVLIRVCAYYSKIISYIQTAHLKLNISLSIKS